MNNFHLPAEWETQKSIWLAFPHNKETWSTQELIKVEKEYCYFISELSLVIKTNIITLDRDHQNHIETLLKEKKNNLNNITFFTSATNDAWIRDFGPDFVYLNGKKTLLNWQYNAWGGKYPPFNLDNNIHKLISNKTGLPVISIDMILEGGSFEVNGKGDLITTESCLLNPNRNIKLSKKEIEVNLQKYLGIQNIIWLKEGIKGDDTDGHIDDFVRFVDEETIICAHTEEKNNPDFGVLNNTYSSLLKVKLNNGNSPKIIKIPTPRPFYNNNEKLPCSYANFLITNNRIFVPIFECDEDQKAISILQKIFKDRKVIGIPSKNIIIGLGSLHCLSKHETA